MAKVAVSGCGAQIGAQGFPWAPIGVYLGPSGPLGPKGSGEFAGKWQGGGGVPAKVILTSENFVCVESSNGNFKFFKNLPILIFVADFHVFFDFGLIFKLIACWSIFAFSPHDLAVATFARAKC